jgi:acyl-CoA reductase-like NAD-dependent aldehyde dehydrogenase
MDRIASLIADATAKGARVLCGAKKSGPCYAPTVLFGVTPEMALEEFSELRWITIRRAPTPYPI